LFEDTGIRPILDGLLSGSCTGWIATFLANLPF
jgi:hypothetical protein